MPLPVGMQLWLGREWGVAYTMLRRRWKGQVNRLDKEDVLGIVTLEQNNSDGPLFWLMLSVFTLQSRTESCRNHWEKCSASFLPGTLLLPLSALPISEFQVHVFPDWPAQWLSLLGFFLLNSLPGSIPIAAEPWTVCPPKELQSK